MSFIPAKCTQCGATIQVDDTKEAGICECCGTAFVTEKAINNYNVTNNISVSNATFNITGADVNNLLLRAKQYEEIGEYEKAVEYYNRILDIDATHELAKEKVIELSPVYIGKTRVSKAEFENVRRIILNEQKIQAIKALCELTGLGIVEAKNFIENFEHLDLYKPQSLSGQQFSNIHTTTEAPLQATKPTDKSGGCYVATAVYGSYDCPQVWTLRRYRDYTLAVTWYGRAFIRTYYAISPTLVKLFGPTKWFKKMWKGKLDCIVANLKSKGVEDTPYDDINWKNS